MEPGTNLEARARPEQLIDERFVAEVDFAVAALRPVPRAVASARATLDSNELSGVGLAVPRPLSRRFSVDIVVVTHNSKADLKRTLPSLERVSEEIGGRVLFVDNASGDGCANWILARERLNTIVIELGENRGYAAAVNVAATRSRADYLILLNPDVLVRRAGTLAHLLDHLENHPEAAVAVPRLLESDGRLQASARPVPTVPMLLARQTALGRTRLGRHLAERYLQPPEANGSHAPVDWALGAAMAIRRSDFDRVSGWDERFFIYFEDVEFCFRLRAAGREVHYLPSATMVHEHRRESAREHGSPLISRARREHFRSAFKFFRKYPHLALRRRHEAHLAPAWAEAIRRAFDIVASASALLLLSPLLLVIAACVKLDSPGPILFRQRRVGRHLRPFTTLKFRTMEDGAHRSVVHDRVRRHVNGKPGWFDGDGAPVFKCMPGDRQMTTRVGRVLRRWSLDELPQLINVLRGEMTFVGYRPPTAYEVDHYPEWYFGRFVLKPGLTGIWQVTGRNGKSYVDMVRCDVEYAKRRNWRLDLALILRTVPAMLTRRGAY